MSNLTTINTRVPVTMLPHRKVFMITEKSNANDQEHGRTDAAAGGRKRKMILIMDEKPQQGNTGSAPSEAANDRNDPEMNSNISNGGCGTTPKLLFFANSVDDQLSQKIEEILPEILSRIKRKNGKNINEGYQTNDVQRDNNNTHQHQHHQHRHHYHSHQNRLLHEEFSDSSNSEHATLNQSNNNANLMLLGAAAAAATSAASENTESIRPITLPPKKNHSKFQRQINNNSNNNSHNNNSNNHNDDDKKIICAATPVIVSLTSLKKPNGNQLNTMKTSNHEHQQQSNKTNHQLNGDIQSINHLKIHHNKTNHHQFTNNKNDDNKMHNHKQSTTTTTIATATATATEAIKSSEKDAIVVQQQNINLTGDFLFLMKMLPMLEKTPEPRKTQVKILIEKIMKQCVSEEKLH